MVKKKCEELLDSDCDSSYLHGFMVELYKQQLDDPSADKEEILKKIAQHCVILSEDVDKVRCKYWNFISESLHQKYAPVV